MDANLTTAPLTGRDTTVPPEAGESGSVSSTLDPREQMRIEFYRTYDVMTGIRIAATLGGFFSLMVLLVVYKSKCKSKSLSDEHLNAAAAAVAIQDEEEQLAAALDAAAASFYSRTMLPHARPRMSLGNMSAPALVLARGSRRFSSIGGYSTLEQPANYYYYYQRGKSLPGSALRFHMRNSDEERVTTNSSPVRNAEDPLEEEELEEECQQHFLTVPQDARRLSSITCSSSDTSYLERRGSAVELGIPAPPPHKFRSKPRGGADDSVAEEPWDFYYPIDIQVIQPTPEVSPCGSERTLYDNPLELAPAGLRPPSRSSLAESLSSSSLNLPSKLAPLASISSVGVSLTEHADFDDVHSIGSDSVFLDEDDELDTEDEVEGFSTDSDYEDSSGAVMKRGRWGTPPPVPLSQHFLQVPSVTSTTSATASPTTRRYRPTRRRLSSPGGHYGLKNESSCATISAKVEEDTSTQMDLTDLPSSSRSCERLGVENDISRRPPLPLPVHEDGSTTSSDSHTLLNSTPPPPNRRDAPISDSPHRTAKSCESLAATPSSSKMLTLLNRRSCDHLIRALNEKTSIPPLKNCSWSQETLF